MEKSAAIVLHYADLKGSLVRVRGLATREPSEHNARGRRRQEAPSTVPTRVCLFTKEKSSEVPSDIPPITSDG